MFTVISTRSFLKVLNNPGTYIATVDLESAFWCVIPENCGVGLHQASHIISNETVTILAIQE